MKKVQFKITEINLRRKMRGTEHIKVYEYINKKNTHNWFWLDNQDIKEMKEEFGNDCFLNVCDDILNINNTISRIEI